MSTIEQSVGKGRVKGGVTQGEIERVMELEAKRQAAGYNPGWTYYRAREQRLLLLAYEHTLGSYAESSSKGYAPHRGRPLRQSEPLLAVQMMPDSCVLKSVRHAVSADSGSGSPLQLPSVPEDAVRSASGWAGNTGSGAMHYLTTTTVTACRG